MQNHIQICHKLMILYGIYLFCLNPKIDDIYLFKHDFFYSLSSTHELRTYKLFYYVHHQQIHSVTN